MACCSSFRDARRLNRSSGSNQRLQRAVLQAARLTLLAVIVWLIRDQHQWYRVQERGREGPVLRIEQVQPFFPSAERFGPWDPQTGGRTVLDDRGEPVGYAVQTSPDCDPLVGYCGATNTLIALDRHERIIGIAILDSEDTPEHVAAVRRDERFLRSFVDRRPQELRTLARPDAVSGATLTSMAIAESIVLRLAGVRTSFRFPDPIQVVEVRRFLPEADRLVRDRRHPRLLRVLDRKGRWIGLAARTAPTTDDLVGYQGPIDTLLVMDTEARIVGIALRKTYETARYVRYVVEEDAFMTFFNDRTLAELARLDLSEAEMEGVSGATMTSMTVAEGLVRTAQELQQQQQLEGSDRGPRSQTAGVVVRVRDLGTLFVLGLASVISLTHLRGNRSLRVAFQLVLIGYLGLINGDLLSQELLVGWARSGVPWRTAPALVLLTAAALAVPIASRRQLYCHYLCPHGALQELIGRRSRWHWRLLSRFSRTLQRLPGLLLAAVVGIAITEINFSLSNLEPFEAYRLGLAGAASLTLAAIGLVACLVIPMAYCRFGCPTGALLRYVRLNRKSHQISRGDLLAVILVATVFVLRMAR